MVAFPWLVEADRTSEHYQQLPGDRGNTQDDPNTDPEEVVFDSSEAEEEEEMVLDDDLSEYGPSLEQHRAHVEEQAGHFGAGSTKRQHARKMEECREFATAVFRDDAITVDRVLKFLQFQAHRELRTQTEEKDKDPLENVVTRKRKRQKKSDATRTPKYKFNIDDYKKVMDHIQNDVLGQEPENWISWNRQQSIEKYLSALKAASSDEMRIALTANQAIKKLVDNVNRRTKMAKVDNDSTALFRITEKFRYPKLYRSSEGWLWDEYKTGSNWKYLARSFRDRYTLLMSVQTCTRHEATLSCMLQSFDVFEHHLPGELEPYSILLRNIYKGKTNQNDSATVLQAKSIRHKDVTFCEQGALAIYLFCRFKIHNEEFDLSNNSWRKVRTTVAVNNSKKQFEASRFKCMGEGTYYEKLSLVFQQFGHHVSHVVHFGRSCSPVLLEFAEVLVQLIEQLGGWNMNVYNKSYSLNLPWPALRAAAGFCKEKGQYRIPRGRLPVDEELKRKVFPDVEKARQLFRSLSKEDQFRLPIAEKFLSVMDCLAGVFVQDICAMRFHGRNVHQLYNDSFFHDELFLDYERRFRGVCTFHIDPRNDPTLDPLKVSVPIIAQHLGDTRAFANQGFLSIGVQLDALQQQNNKTMSHLQVNNQASLHIVNVIGSALQAGFRAHVSSPLVNNGVAPETNETTQQEEAANPVAQGNTTQGSEETGGNGFPEFDRLSCDSTEQIHDDWFGTNGSPCMTHGGLKSLCDNKLWRKSLGDSAKKRENDKKMLQKIKRIGEYMESVHGDGSGRQEIIEKIRVAMKESPKSTETLTGIDKVLKDIQKSANQPSQLECALCNQTETCLVQCGFPHLHRSTR